MCKSHSESISKKNRSTYHRFYTNVLYSFRGLSWRSLTSSPRAYAGIWVSHIYGSGRYLYMTIAQAWYLTRDTDRAFVHDWKTKRDTITAHRTGGTQKGEDPHITVYLSNRADWINVHGDIYVETRNIDRKRKMPIGLTRTERMKLHGDKQPRNPRLYVWTEKDTGRTTEKHNMAMAARSWRGNVNR